MLTQKKKNPLYWKISEGFKVKEQEKEGGGGGEEEERGGAETEKREEGRQ